MKLAPALFLFLLSVPAPAADKDFNGQWNIVAENARNRTWWLEVTGAGTAKLAGSFVGAPGGQVDPLENPKIVSGELAFSFVRDEVRQDYRARFEGGKLTGTMEATIKGEKRPPVPWTGVRAPQIKDVDDGNWKEGTVVRLFNGKNTSGWRKLRTGAPGWVVKDGALVNEPGASDIVSEQKFWNFILRAEYKYSKGSNSGIGLRGRYEIQIYDNYGQPADAHGNGALYSRIAPSTNASRPPGEWQAMEARLVGKTLTVRLNGTLIIDRKPVVGPTAIVMDANEDQPGPVVLQGDHGPIEFRKVEVIPLSR
jgi:hypothetical protein